MIFYFGLKCIHVRVCTSESLRGLKLTEQLRLYIIYYIIHVYNINVYMI